MKLALLLLLLALLGSAPKPEPPAVRVMLSPMTALAYAQAKKSAPVVTEKKLFPLKKATES